MKLAKTLVLAIAVLVAAGCSTIDHRGEGMSAGALVGAAAGYAVGGAEGAAVGATVGGLGGNLGGRAFKKKRGYEEAQLSLREKRNYTKREAMNAFLQCVQNFSQMYDLRVAQDMCWREYLQPVGFPRPTAEGGAQ